MTRPEPITFGSYIASARKKIALSQKQLAERILREEDNQPMQGLHEIAERRRACMAGMRQLIEISPNG